jgi:two-component sensor histidine kinase
VQEAKPSVLYIDDDEGICRLVQKDLLRVGYDIFCVRSGSEGLAILAERNIDVVCLDHFLDGETGLDVLVKIIDLPCRPAIIYVTGSEDINIAIAALKAGAVDFVVKDVQGAFLTLLRKSTGGAIDQLRLRRDKEKAEAEIVAANEQLRLLTEKQTMLLHEMNHRIGNSLQLIISMIRLQASATKDEHAKSVLRQTAERVIAIAQVHQRLYTSEDVQFVDMGPYLTKLLEDQRIIAEGHGCHLDIDLANIRLATDRAISVGIIVTELVTNSLKYAYPEGVGPIRVRLQPLPDDKVLLSVADAGVGYQANGTAGAHTAQGTGVGSRIVDAMAKSLGGALKIDSGPNGTQASIVFTEDKAAVEAGSQPNAA